MGSPKHLLNHPLSGRPLYQHHLDVLTALQKEGVFPEGVFVSGREDQAAELALPEGANVVLDDPVKNGDIGPASGILQAFALKPTATWLLLAVDLPFLTRSSILHLLSSHPTDAPVSLFLHPSDGNPEPLFSVWTSRALEQLKVNCKNGKSGPCRAAKDVWGGKIAPGKGGVKVLEEDWVTDADTPEEWEKAIAALSSKRRKPISYSSAIDRIRRLSLARPISSSSFASPAATSAALSSASPVTVPLVDAVGLRSATSVRALFPHPLHDNSAMDGYAVPSLLLRSASSSSPIDLPVLGRIVAGDPPPPPALVEQIGTNGCWEIMTGAVFPSDAFDAVVKVEDTVAVGDQAPEGSRRVRFAAAPRESQNRRKRGEQVQPGEVLLRNAERITPEKVMLLAAVGVSEVAVLPPAAAGQQQEKRSLGRVGIISTGKEVVPLSCLSAAVEPQPGQVIDCVTPYLCALLRQRGYDPIVLSPSGDSSSAFAASVSSAVSPPPSSSSSEEPLTMLITTAGVSLGVTDHLPSTLSAIGLETVFHGVSIRPGAPVMLSVHTCASTGRRTPVLSLPGNPMASAVGMRGIGGEVLALLEGAEREREWTELLLPTPGCAEEEEKAWEDLAGRVREGGSSFFALPLRQYEGAERGEWPTLEKARTGGGRTGPCALGSLVRGEAWVRIEAAEGGAKMGWWRRF
ncbi:hypothetical protein JCM10213v2_004922 [Rhodosporidiobolus nylandii]